VRDGEIWENGGMLWICIASSGDYSIAVRIIGVNIAGVIKKPNFEVQVRIVT
jgi:hypothetical protein